MKNVLLIGGAGFIGSNIVKQLIYKKYNICILELPESDLSRIEFFSKEIKVYYGKLEQQDIIQNILEENSIDIVIHLASTLIPSSTIDAYLKEFDSIIKPTIRLLSLLSELKIKLVYFSSGGTIYGTKKYAMFSEINETEPISYYGQSKLIIEESIKLENRRSGLRYLILRPSNPYGIRQPISGKQGLIAASIGNILYDKKIEIWGNGSVIRDYIYIDDLINAVITAVEIGGDNEIYNIGSGKGFSVNEVINILRKCTDKYFEVEYLSARSVDVPSLILDISKLRKICDLPVLSLEEGIKTFFSLEFSKKQEI